MKGFYFKTKQQAICGCQVLLKLIHWNVLRAHCLPNCVNFKIANAAYFHVDTLTTM
jgi:hypothetical protein